MLTVQSFMLVYTKGRTLRTLDARGHPITKYTTHAGSQEYRKYNYNRYNVDMVPLLKIMTLRSPSKGQTLSFTASSFTTIYTAPNSAART